MTQRLVVLLAAGSVTVLAQSGGPKPIIVTPDNYSRESMNKC